MPGVATPAPGGFEGAVEDGPEHRTSAAYDRGPLPVISVVIPTFSRAAHWPELVSALEAQTLDSGRFEVVVVDDRSPDSTWKVLDEVASRTPLRFLGLRLSGNVGAGAARTAGISWCRAGVVAFTDDDCLPTPTWLERVWDAFSLDAPDGPPALVVQGRTLPRPEEEEAGGPWARTLWVLGPTWLFETCNVAYRKADLEAVGGFPSRAEAPALPSGRPGCEDAMAGWRVIEGGARLLFVPEALVHHRVVPSSYGEWLRDLQGRVIFPALAVRSPLSRRAFWGRWFLSSRSAATVLAVAAVGGAVITGHRRLVAGVVPWVLLALPEACSRGGRHPAVRLGQLALGDMVGLYATATASVRHRALVL